MEIYQLEFLSVWYMQRQCQCQHEWPVAWNFWYISRCMIIHDVKVHIWIEVLLVILLWRLYWERIIVVVQPRWLKIVLWRQTWCVKMNFLYHHHDLVDITVDVGIFYSVVCEASVGFERNLSLTVACVSV